MPPDGTGKHDPLGTLSTLLQTALDLAGELARDGHLPRLLAAFARFPAADREPLLAKLEDEVQARQRSMETGDGAVGPPNPLASLYIRIYENGRPLPVVTRDTMLRSTIQSTALMAGLDAAARVACEDALLAAMGSLDAGEIDGLIRHHEDLLALASWCESAGGEE